MIRRLLPDAREGIDIGLIVAAVLVALMTLQSTYYGASFVTVCVIGTLTGALVAHLCIVARLPPIFVPVPVVASYYLLGGLVCLRSAPAGGPAPSPATWAELTRLMLHGWGQLLTTVTPVDGNGPLLTLPFVITIAASAAAVTLTRSTRASAPALGPAAALAIAILLGTPAPSSLRWVGPVFALLMMCLVALRAQRRIVQTRTGRRGRLITAGLLLAISGALVLAAAPILPGAGVTDRQILRAHITPPLDLSMYASPLVGFRKYRPDAKQLSDQTLFTVSGLPAGYPIRIATLDDYDQVVFSARNSPSVPALGTASDTFQRVGARLSTTASGPHASIHISIGAAYAAAPDLSAWLPDVGASTAIRFSGPDASEHSEQLRYNLATGSAIVVDRLQSNDNYTLHAVLPSVTLPAQAQPASGASLDSSAFSFVVTAMNRWVSRSASAWQQLLSVAKYMRTHGFYTDGGTGESQYLPGHSLGRLTAFLATAGTTVDSGTAGLVGDDEQYAATLALMANAIGIPARVVLGAIAEDDGVVKGQDVHAWVEVKLATGQWQMIPASAFVPPTDRKPNPQDLQQVENDNTTVVPPPNTSRPPSSLQQLSEIGSNSFRRNSHDNSIRSHWQLPAWLVTVLRWTGPPLLALALVVALIVGAKAARRRRRRRAGSVRLRFAQGWRELVDTARDLGVTISPRMTRREQALALDGPGLLTLAERADDCLFGPVAGSPAQAGDYWSDVSRARRDMMLTVSRRRRWRAAVSPRSLLPPH